ncbi:MAG: hypothetical protein AAGF55_01000 [Pseudomonadota bacterium]
MTETKDSPWGAGNDESVQTAARERGVEALRVAVKDSTGEDLSQETIDTLESMGLTVETAAARFDVFEQKKQTAAADLAGVVALTARHPELAPISLHLEVVLGIIERGADKMRHMAMEALARGMMVVEKAPNGKLDDTQRQYLRGLCFRARSAIASTRTLLAYSHRGVLGEAIDRRRLLCNITGIDLDDKHTFVSIASEYLEDKNLDNAVCEVQVALAGIEDGFISAVSTELGIDISGPYPVVQSGDGEDLDEQTKTT